MRQSSEAVGELARQAVVLKDLIDQMKGGEGESTVSGRTKALAGR
jgi:hypothetical protein